MAYMNLARACPGRAFHAGSAPAAAATAASTSSRVPSTDSASFAPVHGSTEAAMARPGGNAHVLLMKTPKRRLCASRKASAGAGLSGAGP